MLKPFELFDAVKRQFSLKNDAELARKLEYTPPQISKTRARVIATTDTLILRIHEVFGLTVKEIRALLAKDRAESESADAK